jgi:putative ABC transport system permease protein
MPLFRSTYFFFGLFYRFSIRHMAKFPIRALIVFLGISLGAAVFTSVRLSVHASVSSFNQSMEMITGVADRVVTRPGGRVPETLVGPLLKLPFVKSVSPLLFTYVQPAIAGKSPFLLIGFDPILDRPFRNWQLQHSSNSDQGVWLDLIRISNSIFVGQPLLDDLGIKPQDRLTLEHVGQSAGFIALESLSSEGLALVEGGRIAITDIATFQEFTHVWGEVDRIDLLFDSPVSEKQIDQIHQILPEGITLGMPNEDQLSGQQMISAYQLNLSVLSFVSLFVGMFLVYSLVALNAASRRKELAILRSTGAPAKLIFFIFIAEGTFFGLVGWLMAIPISSVFSKYLLYGVSETISTLFVRVSVDNLTLSAWEIFVSLAMTMFISVLAAFQPAREAMKVSPKEAMDIGQSSRTYRKSSRYLAILGLLFVLMVWPLSCVPPPENFPFPGYLATFVLFLGFSMLSPWSLEMVGKIAGPALLNLGKEPAWLAGRYVQSSGMRTAISVGALITAVALFSALVIMVHSFRRTVELWANQTVAGDIFIRSKMADINRYKDPVPQNVMDFFHNLDEPVDIDIYRRLFLNYGKNLYQFEALKWDVYLQYGSFFWTEGDMKTGLQRLKNGEGVLVSEVFANRTGLGAGNLFQTSIRGAWFELPIIGVVRDYRTQGGVVYYSLKHYQDKTKDSNWGGVRVFFKNRQKEPDEAILQMRNRIIECCGDSVNVTLGIQLRKAILKIFDETFAITTILLLIALVVAALGITSTLTVLVLERSRELNTIFAVGGSYGQIRAMIFWEAFLMVLTGEFLGILCGVALSYLLVFVINKQSFGWTFLYSMDLKTLAVSYPLIILTALAAAIPAIRMVFKQPPANLLRER